jgi:hypothetical protein
MHRPGGKPFRFLLGIDSVMTRHHPVRCGKSRRVVANGASGRNYSASEQVNIQQKYERAAQI